MIYDVCRKQAVFRGQALVEYAVILVLGICVCMTALNYLGTTISDKVSCIAVGLLPGNNSNVDC